MGRVNLWDIKEILHGLFNDRIRKCLKKLEHFFWNMVKVQVKYKKQEST